MQKFKIGAMIDDVKCESGKQNSKEKNEMNKNTRRLHCFNLLKSFQRKMQRRVNLFFGREEQLNTFLVYKSEAHPPDSSLILINQNVLYLYLDRPLLGARCFRWRKRDIFERIWFDEGE